ncbi:MAG TPA: DUF3017 domain-containing protein [Streptosporangiaceae bacterium]|nr:DUF3017 domain-containing protein [Streptosporangiaceae bacterium]
MPASGAGAAGQSQEQVATGQPPRAAARHSADGGGPRSARRRAPRSGPGGQPAANLPYVLVLAGLLGGLLWVWLSKDHVKGGMLMFAVSLLLAGGARLALAPERAGLLASRRRAVDVAAFAVLGAGLLVAALLIPSPS